MMQQELLLVMNGEETRLNPTTEFQSMDVVSGQKIEFSIERGIYYDLKMLEIIE